MSDRIRDALDKYIRNKQTIQTLACKVKSVDEGNATCVAEPLDGGAEYFAVRLRSVIDNGSTGIIPIPEVGSHVLIGILGNSDNDAVVLLIDKLKQYKLICDDVQLNGDAFGGLIKIQELVNAINNLEQKHNALIATFNAHTHASNGTPPAIPSLDTVAVTQKSQLENIHVKHG